MTKYGNSGSPVHRALSVTIIEVVIIVDMLNVQTTIVICKQLFLIRCIWYEGWWQLWTRKPWGLWHSWQKDKLRLNRWYTVQSNEKRKHIFFKVCIYFCLLSLNYQFPWSAEQKTYLKYLRITNNLHFPAASLIIFCTISYQSIWNLTTYKLSLYITVSSCCINYVVMRPVIVNCGNFLI